MKTVPFQIIMTDDDDDDRFLVGNLFSQHYPDCVLRFAENGHELIQLVEDTHAAATSLILLDLNMPVMNGFGALRYLKQSPDFQHIPIVVLSTSREQQDIDKSYALGANAFLSKPASYSDLKFLVDRLHEFWLIVAKTPGQAIWRPSNDPLVRTD
jgi:CheY-like chemotaxis protein